MEFIGCHAKACEESVKEHDYLSASCFTRGGRCPIKYVGTFLLSKRNSYVTGEIEIIENTVLLVYLAMASCYFPKNNKKINFISFCSFVETYILVSRRIH